MASTYELIETTTLTSSAFSVTFSSITQDYRDLVLVADGVATGNLAFALRLNGDSGSNYNYVTMDGDGSATGSTALSNVNNISINQDVFTANGDQLQAIVNILDYTATDKHKSVISRCNSATVATNALAGRWADTSAVTSLSITDLFSGALPAGSTFSLYGIAS